MDTGIIALFLKFAMLYGMVLMLVALGGMFSEHSGIINIALEGIMVIGALIGVICSIVFSKYGLFVKVAGSILCAGAAGMAYSFLLAFASINLKADQTIGGTALNILATAIAMVIAKRFNSGSGKLSDSARLVYSYDGFVYEISGSGFRWMDYLNALILFLIEVVFLSVIILIITYIKKKKSAASDSSEASSFKVPVVLYHLKSFGLSALVILSLVCYKYGIEGYPILLLAGIALSVLALGLCLSRYMSSKKELAPVYKTAFQRVILSFGSYSLGIACALSALIGIPLIFMVYHVTINVFLFLGIALLLFSYIIMYKTKVGLRLRACGEHPQAADSVGISVNRMRYLGVLISGFLGGIGGFAYILPANPNWDFKYGIAGMGFLALAVMIFGQWKPFKIFFAAMFFAVFKSLADIFDSISFLKALGWPKEIYQMIPFAASMVVLTLTSKKSRAPKAEGIPYDKGQR